MNIDKQIMDTIESITDKLSTIEAHMAWLIKPDVRFRVGQRVEWSRRGRNAGFNRRRKVAAKGTVKGISGFSLIVKLDGLKQEKSYHHAFFNPVTGPKLF